MVLWENVTAKVRGTYVEGKNLVKIFLVSWCLISNKEKDLKIETESMISFLM